MLTLPAKPGTLTDEQRSAHNTHSVGAVLLVLSVILLYVYAFTYAGRTVGLPLPQALAERCGLQLKDVFTDDGVVKSTLWVSQAEEFKNTENEMLAYYCMLAAAFLCVYFLPVRLKRDALSIGTLLMIGVLCGRTSLGWFLFAHLATYLILHPDRRARPWTAALPGCAAVLLFHGKPLFLARVFVLLPVASYFAYFPIRILCDHPRLGPILRACASQSFLIIGIGTFILGKIFHFNWSFHLGMLLFFGQWLRLIPYYLDHSHGLIPPDLPLRRYLATFLCPALLPLGFYEMISQGYAYTEATYLCENKNRIVLGGAKLLLVGLLYLVLGRWLCYRLAEGAGLLGINAYHANIKNLTRAYLAGGHIATASLLVTSLLELLRFSLWWGGISHFKVGVWRILGFQVDRNFNYWLLSTNMVELWRRWTFHYREFLVRAFYYPVFFRLSHLSPAVRITAATFAAAFFGNFIWGHALEVFFYESIMLKSFFPRWPYFALISASIALTQLYQRRYRSGRKPWTRGPAIAGDLVCAYLTIQFYALIHVFSLIPSNTSPTAWDLTKLFLVGFGIRI